MTAKEYLSKLRSLDHIIEMKEREIELLRNDMMGAKAIEYKADKIQVSVNPDRMLECIAKIDELERQLWVDIQEMMDYKDICIRQISQLKSEKQRRLLFSRYVENKSWKDVSFDLGGIAWPNVYTCHGRALKNFQKQFL